MTDRLVTSQTLESKIIQIQECMNFSTKAAVIRLAIGLSLKTGGDPRIGLDKDVKDNLGGNYHKHTIFGDDEIIYYLMFKCGIQEDIKDDDVFPDLAKAHLIRGMEILFAQYQLLGNSAKITSWLLDQI